MKRLLAILIFVACYGGMLAQQEPQFNQYMFNRALLNPADAGLSGSFSVAGIARHQWMGYKDINGNAINPRTYGFTFDMPVYAISSGAGLTVQQNSTGAEKNLEIRLQYAYHLTFRKRHTLSFGFSFGLLDKSIDYAGLIPSEFDPLLESGGKENGMITDLGLGLNYRFNENLYAGFSAMNLLGSSAEIGGPEFTMERHYYLFSGMDFELAGGSSGFVLTPGILLKASKGATNAEINAILTYDEFLWGGVLYRIDNAAGIMAGIHVNGLRIGISYDYTLSADFAPGTRNSLEFFVSYSYSISPKAVKRSGFNTRNL